MCGVVYSCLGSHAFSADVAQRCWLLVSVGSLLSRVLMLSTSPIVFRLRASYRYGRLAVVLFVVRFFLLIDCVSGVIFHGGYASPFVWLFFAEFVVVV